MANKPLNILVGLDLSKMDAYLIDYIKTLNQIFIVDKITFLHNIKLGELPKDLLSDERLQTIQRKIKNRLERLVEDAELNFPYTVKVSMENLSEIAFQHIGKKEHFDLLIVGNKQELQGNGALAYKLLRLFPSPVMAVPETFKTPIKTLVNAITFSKYTKAVLNWAERFTSKDENLPIKQLSVNVSKLYYYSLMTHKEAEKAIQEDISQKRKKWEKDFQAYGEMEIIQAEEKSIPTTLLSYAKQKNAEIIILGIKSNSMIRDLMIGSVANELFARASDMVLLFVKSKNKS